MNGYTYSNSNPATMSDPDGLKTWESDTGPTTDSQVVTKKSSPPGRPPGSRAKTQDFGGRCPAGQKQSCAATSRKHSAVNRARNHDPGAKPDPSAYDPEHYWDWNDGVFSIVGACAPETGRFYGTTRCSATQVQLATDRLVRYGQTPRPLEVWVENVRDWAAEHPEVTHAITSFFVGIGITAAAVACGASVVCGVAVGLVGGTMAGTSAHFGIAKWIGEDITPEKLQGWALESFREWWGLGSSRHGRPRNVGPHEGTVQRHLLEHGFAWLGDLDQPEELEVAMGQVSLITGAPRRRRDLQVAAAHSAPGPG